MGTTTLKDALSAFNTFMQTLVGVDLVSGPGAIRKASWGNGSAFDGMVPAVSYLVVDAQRRESGSTLEWLIQIKIRFVFQVYAAGGSEAVSNGAEYIALFADLLDDWARPTGVEGGDELLFSMQPPTNATHGNLAVIEGPISFTVTVVRGSN